MESVSAGSNQEGFIGFFLDSTFENVVLREAQIFNYPFYYPYPKNQLMAILSTISDPTTY